MKKIIIEVVLFVLILFLGYKCFQSIMIPQKFQELQKARNSSIIQRLKDIRTAEESYKRVYGKYTGSFDTLINFVKFDSVKIIRSLGSLTDEQVEQGMTEAEAVKQGFIIREEIKVPAYGEIQKSLDKDLREEGRKFPTDQLRYVPFTKGKHQFKLGADILRSETGVDIPVFEARISNKEIFEDLEEDYKDEILEMNGERLRLKKYPGLKVGDIKEANNNVGNWE